MGFTESDRIEKTLQNPEPRTYNGVGSGWGHFRDPR
jgi:hypothetical protein